MFAAAGLDINEVVVLARPPGNYLSTAFADLISGSSQWADWQCVPAIPCFA